MVNNWLESVYLALTGIVGVQPKWILNLAHCLLETTAIFVSYWEQLVKVIEWWTELFQKGLPVVPWSVFCRYFSVQYIKQSMSNFTSFSAGNWWSFRPAISLILSFFLQFSLWFLFFRCLQLFTCVNVVPTYNLVLRPLSKHFLNTLTTHEIAVLSKWPLSPVRLV